MAKLRINYTMWGSILTGGSRVLFEIANELVHRGHHLTITTIGNAEDHRWFPLEAEINYVKPPYVTRTIIRLSKMVPHIYVNPFPYNMIEELGRQNSRLRY